ncbi:site-specific integrase, partial [Limosilactobacillus coleohominis]
MVYPLYQTFHTWLLNKHVTKTTINNYDSTLNQFFTFLENQQHLGGQDALPLIQESDLHAYFALQNISQSTYNKKLSHLNQYFLFLVDHQVIKSFPTIAFHGKNVAVNLSTNRKWHQYVPQLLENDQVSMYTRVTLLLLAHGYDIQEILRPGFYEVFVKLKFTNEKENIFQSKYQHWITPLQQEQHAHELLLKKRINLQNPSLSLAGLHKYLKADQINIPFKLSPQQLHQSYVLDFIDTHPQWSQQQLRDHLRLDPASMMYYQNLLTKEKASG